MARLVLINGAEAGASYSLEAAQAVIGRQNGTEIKLNGTNVSRRHARLFREGTDFWLEDLNSSNGTFLNGAKLSTRAQLKPRDEIRVGPYLLRFEATEPRDDLTIHARAVANTRNADLYRENPAQKLQLILQIATDLGRSLDLELLLPDTLKHLLALFPQAERGLIILLERGKPVVRAQKQRVATAETARFSNSIVQKVLAEGVGIFAEDLETDARFADAQSICSLGVRSFICVPLQSKAGNPFGVLQLERTGAGHKFTPEDLNLLTAIALQVSVTLENAQLHEELIARQRIERDLAMAREIQLGYLPAFVPDFPQNNFELHAELFPAYEISGDFYDYFKVGADKLAIAVADVSGKGMPAALFMSMVRALLRNFAQPGKSAGHILQELNNAVAQQNPKCQFVTIVLCILEPAQRAVELSSGGHPPALLWHGADSVEILNLPQGPLLGFETVEKPFPTSTRVLERGDLLVLYTDGVTEAPKADHEMFGLQRLQSTSRALSPKAPLKECAEAIRNAVQSFTGNPQQEDDITLALLRVT